MLRAGGWQWSKAKLMLSRKRERKEERVRERLRSSRTQLCVRRFIHPKVQTRTDSYTRCLEISQFCFFWDGGQQSWERTELQPCKMNPISKIRHFFALFMWRCTSKLFNPGHVFFDHLSPQCINSLWWVYRQHRGTFKANRGSGEDHMLSYTSDRAEEEVDIHVRQRCFSVVIQLTHK